MRVVSLYSIAAINLPLANALYSQMVLQDVRSEQQAKEES